MSIRKKRNKVTKSKNKKSKENNETMKSPASVTNIAENKNKAAQQVSDSHKRSELEALKADEARRVSMFLNNTQKYSLLKDITIKDDKLLLQLPDGLYGKFIVKSAEYLVDEWMTLQPKYFELSEEDFSIYILIDQLEEDSYEPFCAELNECIEHFLARS